jgi:hypothetical protein
MHRMLPRFALLALSFAGSAALAGPATATSCGDLTKIAPPDATITSATEETGSFESPHSKWPDPTCWRNTGTMPPSVQSLQGSFSAEDHQRMRSKRTRQGWPRPPH